MIVCPWHRYVITLDTGEGMYQETHGGAWSSKGSRQRIHDVFTEDGKVFVKLRSGKGEFRTQDDDDSLVHPSIHLILMVHPLLRTSFVPSVRRIPALPSDEYSDMMMRSASAAED